METTEKIVEAYVRYVKGGATIPNLRCAGQKEIDLFAIDPVTDERWHIETSVMLKQVQQDEEIISAIYAENDVLFSATASTVQSAATPPASAP